MKNNSYNNAPNVSQEDINMTRNCKPEPIAPIIEEPCNKCFHIDSSLLFFFLILVCILKNSNCDICQDTLLMFFLLLVMLFNNFGRGCEC
ncbi:MAG: hypothetical protein RR436_06710 [Clostridia bacterium]